MILISACLLGGNCKYNGGNNLQEKLQALIKDKDYRLICPEVEGGLPVPRPPAEIIGGDGFDVLEGKASVQNNRGDNVTSHYLKGAKRLLEEIDPEQIQLAIMKSKSPSCGLKKIHAGKFNGNLREGPGVCTALFIKNGIKVVNEKDMDDIKKLI